MSWVQRLALLASNVVKAILEGQMDLALMLKQLERLAPPRWDEQRNLVAEQN